MRCKTYKINALKNYKFAIIVLGTRILCTVPTALYFMQ